MASVGEVTVGVSAVVEMRSVRYRWIGLRLWRVFVGVVVEQDGEPWSVLGETREEPTE